MAGGSLNAASLRITSPEKGAMVYSGRTLTVNVEASSGPFRGVQLSGSLVRGIYTLTASPYEFKVPIPPGTASNTYTLVAVGTTTAGETVQSERITVYVERPDPPLRIWNEIPGRLSLPFVGHTMWLQVNGDFADGSRVTLTYSSLTTYASDNPAVVAVDSTGLVTAVGPGSAKITITNVGTSVVVPVDVVDAQPPDKTKH
jgi:hypothetical protein